MGLVDYSDSESDCDSPQTSTPAVANPAAPAKKPFQKLVDKTNPGKILVNLPSASAADEAPPSEEPVAKRVKTGGSRFGGFSSFLPAPKTVTRPTPASGSGGKAAPKVGINLKTSSEAAFSREAPSIGGNEDDGNDFLARTSELGGLGLKLPPPKASAAAQPSIPEGQKSEEDVKLVGKPMMFKPLSVSRKPGKKNGFNATTVPKAAALGSASTQRAPAPSAAPPSQEPKAAPPKKKVSLFSITDDTPTVDASPEDDISYEPGFTSYGSINYEDVQQQYANYTQPLAAGNADPNSLDSIADDLNLDPVARRELFGRGGGGNKATAKSVINFNLDQEYRHNEELRATGALEQQQHNPLRAIKPGKHSLQQLVNQVQTQRDALEENFAKNRSTQKQAGSKYGWR